MNSLHRTAFRWRGSKGPRLKLIGRMRAFAAAEGGAAAVYFLLSAPIWIGGMGLGAEVGTWYLRQQTLQSMADTIADSVAGRAGTGAQRTELEGIAERVLNEVSFDRDRLELSINVGLVNPSDPDDGTRVEVAMTRTVDRLMTRFFREDDVTLTASAAAVVRRATPGCVLALAQAGARALQLSSANLQVNGCEALSNSTDERSIFVPTGNRLTTDCARTAGWLLVQGQINVRCRNDQQTGPGVPEAGFTVDPYASLEPPEFNCQPMPRMIVEAPDQLPPPSFVRPDGTPVRLFCGGLEIGVSMTLPEGLYIIREYFKAASSIRGIGVTFFVVPGTTTTTEVLLLQGSPQLTAPTVGEYAGILLFGQRAIPSNATARIAVGVNSQFNGAIYFPGAPVRFRANGTLTGCTQIIGNTVLLEGAWTLNSVWQNPGACPAQRPIVASNVVRLVQ